MKDNNTKRQVCPPQEKKNVYFQNGFIDRFLFSWVNKHIEKNERERFEQHDNWGLKREHTSEEVTKTMLSTFQKMKHKKYALLRTFLTINKWMFAKLFFYSCLARILEYCSPFFIDQTLTYISQPEKDFTTGILLALGIIFSRVMGTVFEGQNIMLFTIIDIAIPNAVKGLIYEKMLKFPLTRSPDHSFGSLMNHLEVDSDSLSDITWVLEGFVVLPISMAVGFWLMYNIVGISCFVGIGVLVLLAGASYLIGKKHLEAENVTMEKKDERMKISAEILNSIKYIKMLGQSMFFLNKVNNAREEELHWQRKQFICSTLQTACSWIASILTTTAIFGVYVLSGNEVTARSLFTTLSALNVLQFPLRSLPARINYALEFKVSMDRISKFLMDEEIQTECIQHIFNKDSDTAIKITNGSFFWSKADQKQEVSQTNSTKNLSQAKTTHESSELELTPLAQMETEKLLNSCDDSSSLPSVNNKPILKNISLEIKKGSFVAILGDVGSGKSSLLYSLVGEMAYNPIDPPQIELNGSMSYVPQQSWILNTTVKNNILFGQEFDSHRYHQAIQYSCLESDLDMLIHKDETEIGEKGVNLSGGQKARVSLARALYRQSDIYLLDDPLSAVDAHVGKFILKECFTGYLKEKTRLLVTHKFESLKYVDHILIFKDGKVVEQGTLENLKDSTLFKEVEQKYKVKEIQEKEVPVIDEQALEESKKEPLKSDKDSLEPMSSKSEKDEKHQHEEEAAEQLNKKLMLDEDREEGAISWKVWKYYFSYYGGTVFYVLFFIVMMIWTILQAASNSWLSYWCDNTEKYGYSKLSFFGLYWALRCGGLVIYFLKSAMLFQKSLDCSQIIHNDMFSKVLQAPVNLFFDRVPIGRILNRFGKDIEVLDADIAWSFDFLITGIFTMATDILVCMVTGTSLTLPLALVFFVAAFKLQGKRINLKREVNRLMSISRSPIVSHFSESLNGLTSIRVYQDEKRFFDKFNHLKDENMKNEILNNSIGQWFDIRITLYSTFFIIPSIAIPLLLDDNYSITPGLAGLILTYAFSINEDIGSLLLAYSSFESDIVALERCHAFTQIQGEADTQSTSHDASIKNDWPNKGAVEFVNYSVKYRPNLPLIINDLNVIINPGEKVGVVGKTGSGKSTLFLSLLRLLEASHGKVLIDDIDISQVPLEQLRKKITIISQDPVLFNGTLRENLDLLSKHTDEELWESLGKTCMKEKFELEDGLDTEIREGGENLSAGEKQLLCIARAILAKNKIVLIDEATSNIDPRTEQTILDTIKDSFASCTVITIAHRLKTVISSDKILVMKEGKVLEFDTPAKLVSNENTYFYKLWMEHEHAE